ncbi:MAG TPA: hypothetical protein VEK08_01515 [Planctomycetota bacterium]|nr:hypothetical protein [Planctomycetota bacterium]
MEPVHGSYTQEEYDALGARWEVVGGASAGVLTRLLLRHVDGQLCAAYGDRKKLEAHQITFCKVKLAYQTDGGYWTIVFPMGPVRFFDASFVEPLAAAGRREVADYEGIATPPETVETFWPAS